MAASFSSTRSISLTAAAATLGLHVAIGLGLASILYVETTRPAIDTTVVNWNRSDEIDPLIVLPKLASQDGDHGAAGGGGVVAVAPPASVPMVAAGSDDLLATAEEPAIAAAASTGGTGSGSGEAIGSGEGTGTPSRFFEADSQARRIVYVVDASGSMRQPHPGEHRTRLGRVKAELVRSIQSLSHDQRFFIVFFNDEAWPMPGRLMIPGGDHPANRRYLSWATATIAGGQTDPEPALRGALSLDPDTIFFLTDGTFKPATVATILKANTDRVPIHTIALGDAKAEPLLRPLAEHSGGSYLFIPGVTGAAPPSTDGPATARAVQSLLRNLGR